MSVQSRVHRRLHRHRPSPKPAMPMAPPPGDALLSYLSQRSAAVGAPSPAPDTLREAAHALMHNGEPLRLGLRAGELPQRINWFWRLLELWPEPEREEWLKGQMQAAERHALAGSPLHEALDRRVFDPAIPSEQRVRLQALWLAVVAPGAVSLDSARREREQAEAMGLLSDWLG